MKTPQELIEYCLNKNGAYIDYPFGPDSEIIKVEKKIFAQFFLIFSKNRTSTSPSYQSNKV